MAALNAAAWGTLVVYALVMLVVIRPVRISVPARVARRLGKDASWNLPLDLRSAPLIGVIILLATTAISGDVVRVGIVGSPTGVQPYDVLVLFISLAYISTALDSTGGLRALAFWISQRAATQKSSGADKTASGPKLYVYFYLFFFLASAVTGNDPIILSGTAFLAYFTRVCGITDSRAWTYAQFAMANVASAILVSSNPTNVLISGAFGLNFLTGFTVYTTLPSVISAIVAFPIIYGYFKYTRPPLATSQHASQGFIPPQLLPPDVSPRSVLHDPVGAVFHTVLILVTLVLLVGTSFKKGVQVWMVTAPAGIFAFLADVVRETFAGNGRKKAEMDKQRLVEQREPEAVGLELDDLGGISQVSSTKQEPPTEPTRGGSVIGAPARWCRERYPGTSGTISRLPLGLLLFAGGVFVLSNALTSVGWTAVFAGWLIKLCPTTAASVFTVGYFAAFLSPFLGTNIGITSLFVEILVHPSFSNSPEVFNNPKILTGAIYSLALASNLGALSAIPASLAGLLWTNILKAKGIEVKAKDFAINLVLLLVLSTVSSAIVLLEIEMFGAV